MSNAEKLKVKEVIIVEGKYDKNAVLQAVDGTVVTTGGFALFKDKELRSLLVRLARERGVIVLTDSDGGGLVIRNHIKGLLPPGTVRHAYIPPRPGKEPRKRKPGAEGLLGVEGVTPDEIRTALINAGATEPSQTEQAVQPVTKRDLYEWGLSGGVNSAKLRKELQKKLDLPGNLSAKALCEVLTLLGIRPV
ncbi:MAG: DUF4093 domain-containing protein [Oscillospiraceae bacterium]|jgi:ribonuclease M5|nr:DUF4093 domain-containing protein [Oscillospiraceae bacterium]